jgi:L-rhamnose mutarotase
MDQANDKVGEWEKLMWKFQQPLPWAENGEKWIVMDKIFQL